MSNVRVLVADDSSVAREVLQEVLEADGDITVIGTAVDGRDAATQVARLKPDLTTIDLQMPGFGGLEAIEEIMSQSPVPILVVTAQPSTPGSDLVYEAVRRGALDLAQKPALGDDGAAALLRAKVRHLARVPVVRHLRPWHSVTDETSAPARARSSVRISQPIDIVLLGASAGGPSALVAVLRALPATYNLPVCLVQHLPVGFMKSFADHLRRQVALPVKIVREATPIRGGFIMLPDDGRHLVISHRMAFPGDADPVQGHRPAVDVLFQSAAAAFKDHAAAVILSGIGSDGVEGMRQLRQAGALTIAQDEATSAVFGMPKAAAEAGVAARVLPLPEIGPLLASLTHSPLAEDVAP